MLDALVSWVRDCVAPPRCVGCHAVSNRVFCGECEAEAPVTHFDEIDGVPLVAAGAYAGPLARGIRRFKYERQPALAEPLASLLVERARDMALPSGSVWVPVPLHYVRLVERGYNQSALLAAALASRTGTRVDASALERSRDTPHQAELERAARLANVEEAFVVRKKACGPVVLVDDVITTGATVRACLRALTREGVKVRAVFTLARTHPL